VYCPSQCVVIFLFDSVFHITIPLQRKQIAHKRNNNKNNNKNNGIAAGSLPIVMMIVIEEKKGIER
jgi:hypothetical protein